MQKIARISGVPPARRCTGATRAQSICDETDVAHGDRRDNGDGGVKNTRPPTVLGDRVRDPSADCPFAC